MKKILQKLYPLLLSVLLACPILPARVEASFEIPGTCLVQADEGMARTVKTLDYGYERNTYFSLRDLAMVFQDTDSAFSLEITKNAVSLNLETGYIPVRTEKSPWENVPWEEILADDPSGETLSWEMDGNPDIPIRRNEFEVNGETVSYYTLILGMPSGGYDCFMMAADLAMILDVNIAVPMAGSLQISTQEPFSPSPAVLEQDGYFCGVNGVLVGDATTGEIYYHYQADTAYPIASTSKLMTCLLAMEAIGAGQLTLEQQITISEAAELLAGSGDGVLPLKAGEQITVQDLLAGALLPSSNECALCLAEAVAGTEEAFVERMNQKAQELGLSQTVFFNSNGLPVYTESPVPAKLQNRMSAEDMFRMVSYLLRVYPQITDITSLDQAVLTSIGQEVRNTNPLLQNLPQVTGLKTGTTNKAGACLVTSLAAEKDGLEHALVVVVLGTEDSIERGRVSGLLARYALQAFYGEAEKEEDMEAGQVSGSLPVHAEAAVAWVLRAAGAR